MSEPTDPIPRAEVLDLLAVIRDFADIPLPGLTDADERGERNLLRRRVDLLCNLLSIDLSPRWIDTFDVARAARILRASIAETPVTYTVWKPPTERLRDGALAEQRHQVEDPAVPPLAVAGGAR